MISLGFHLWNWNDECLKRSGVGAGVSEWLWPGNAGTPDPGSGGASQQTTPLAWTRIEYSCKSTIEQPEHWDGVLGTLLRVLYRNNHGAGLVALLPAKGAFRGWSDADWRRLEGGSGVNQRSWAWRRRRRRATGGPRRARPWMWWRGRMRARIWAWTRWIGVGVW